LDAPDGLVSDMGRVEFRFSSFGDGVSASAREVHGLHRTYHRLGNSTTLDARLVHGLVRLEIVLLLMHDWCTVCVKRTIGSEIVLEAPDGTPS
jgi:hypothetical protein